MALNTIIVFSLFVTLCLCQYSSSNFKQKVCLYSGQNQQILTPLALTNANCNGNTVNCMNGVYKYNAGLFRYTGPASLKPVKGEVVMFLSQAENGDIDFVSFLNANITTTMNASVQITGAQPTNILLKDDPANGDLWNWSPETNSGSFLWQTQPDYTDGVIIGHIEFVDNYCIRSSYRSTTVGKVPISKLSILSGTVAAPTRLLSVDYTPGSTFEFCQYPRTATVYTNATCPNSNNGKATLTIAFGPNSNNITWYRHDGTPLATNTASVTNLAPGTYHVQVDDKTAMGCTAERTVVISAPYLFKPTVVATPFTCTAKGSASVIPTGGSGGFTYEWKKGATIIGTGSSVFNLNMGTYSVCVSDSCGSINCTDFEIDTSGCCGDGICQLNEACSEPTSCPTDCGACCKEGTIKDGEECVVCPAGTRSTTVQSYTCTSCPANTFNAGGNDACVNCPENTYSALGSDKCIRCPLGKARLSGASSCAPCADGQYADPCGGCVDAPAGTRASSGDWAPTPCNPGKYSSAGSSSCTPCEIGYYSSTGAAECTRCPTGTSTVSTGAFHPLLCI